jgi:hypothetical protein
VVFGLNPTFKNSPVHKKTAIELTIRPTNQNSVYKSNTEKLNVATAAGTRNKWK